MKIAALHDVNLCYNSCVNVMGVCVCTRERVSIDVALWSSASSLWKYC